MIKCWSSTQRSITLSSAEAGLVAAVKTCTELSGVTQLMKDRGNDTDGDVFVDSSAAIGVVHRKGNGKLRHVRVGLLWIQEKQEEGELDVKKILGDDNPADLLTKNVPAAKVEQIMELIGREYKTGRAEVSVKLKT